MIDEHAPVNEKLTGRIKWFNNERGYGFIELEQGGDDVFIHYQQIESSIRYKKLNNGEKVRLNIITTPSGLQARNLTGAN